MVPVIVYVSGMERNPFIPDGVGWERAYLEEGRASRSVRTAQAPPPTLENDTTLPTPRWNIQAGSRTVLGVPQAPPGVAGSLATRCQFTLRATSPGCAAKAW